MEEHPATISDREATLIYLQQLVDRVRGNVRRMAVAVGITTVGVVAMVLSRPWAPPISARQLSAYLVLFAVSAGAIWFASRLLKENRLLEREAQALADELDLELE